MKRILKYAAILLVLELIVSLFTFAQVSAAVTIGLSQAIGTPGTTVVVSGTSTTLTDVITVSFDTTAFTPTTAVAGNWSTSILIPATIYGLHTIYASGTGGTISTTFTVTPKITLTPSSGTTGNTITVTGWGFAASSYVNITFNSISVRPNVATDTTGTLASSTTFVVPASTTGTYNVVATDTVNTAITTSTTFSFSAPPTITLNKTSGPVGTPVAVTGANFSTSDTTIQVTLNGNAVTGATATPASGVWTVNLIIPTMSGGSVTIGAYGSVTTLASVATVPFSITPTISLNKTSAPPGSAINISGTGFGSTEQIAITMDNNPIPYTARADANGTWNTSFNVPSAAGGSHNIGASGPTTAATSVTPVSFTISPAITINKSNGTMGTSVTVNGTGFGASETGITVTFDDTQVGSTTTASSTGSWSIIFTVPASSGGSHRIDAKGSATAAASVNEMAFTTLPTVSLGKVSGAAGTSTTVNGYGFVANENNIKVLYDAIEVSTGITADAAGSWSATFTIPASSAGTHTIKAVGSVTQTVTASGQSFSISSSIKISPTTGNVGASVNVTGSGFATNSPLSFAYDGEPITSVQATTDESGNFNKSISIPKSTAGSHTIKVTDGSNHNSATTFTVESTPPPVPNPTSPSDGTKQGLTGNISPDFKWSSVTDPSGVSYELQIDTDPDFSHPILTKLNLTGTHYTLTKAEALSKGHYYWRVKAIDGASNASAWSQPLTLTSGIMSSGILVLLIIIVIVVIAAIVFIFLVRPAMKKRKVAAPAAAGFSSPEIVIPEVVSTEYRTLESDDPTKRKPLPWRLALPQATQPPKGGKSISGEDQARLKVIIDFAKSLPLLECGNNTDWIVNIAENNTGIQASPELYGQLLRGEIQVQYEPAWTRHPIFRDLQDLLEGQSVLQDLSSFVDLSNRTTSESVRLLQNIYKDTTTGITWDILENNGWGFIAGVYNDSIGWFLGKYLREPSDKDYTIKQEGDTFGIYGAANTPFEGLMAQAPGEKEAQLMRTLHLKLRRTYRNSDNAKDVVSMLTQLNVQRNKLLNTFNQFNRLNP